MKKFLNLMLVAFIALGVASCENFELPFDNPFDKGNGSKGEGNGNNTDVTVDGFSFIAEIEQTRADVVEDGDAWKTVWTGDDKLRVIADGKSYIFANSEEELTRFECEDSNAANITNAKTIVISTYHEGAGTVDSDAGRKGLSLYKTYTSFPKDRKVSLAVRSAFFRYSSASSVTIKSEGKLIFSGVDGSSTSMDSITLPAGEDVWVPFEVKAATIAVEAIIGGKVVKSMDALEVEAGMIYNLGTLEGVPTMVYLNAGVWNVDGAWFAAYFFNENAESVAVTMTDEDGDGIFEGRVPENMQSVIFCRMNPEFTEFAWNDEVNTHVWNQTEDLYIGIEPENYYYVVDWSVGVWGNKDGYVAPKATVGVVGSFQGWDVASPVAMDYAEDGWLVASGVELFKGDGFKFTEGKTWDEPNYGYEGSKLNAAVDTEYTLVLSGNDIIVTKNGKFDIYFNLSTLSFKYTCVEEFTDRTVDIVIENRAEWNPLYIHLSHNGTAITPEEGALVEGNTYAVNANYIGETLSYYFTTTDKSTEPQNVTIKRDGATVYVVEDSSEIIPGELSAYSVPGVHNNWDTSATPMYVAGDLCAAFNVAATEFKIHNTSNSKWYGLASGSLSLGTWTTLSDNGAASNIIVAEGIYDIYFSEGCSMVCVVEAGAEVPALPEVSEDDNRTIYLYAGGSSLWDQAGAWFEAWVWGSTTPDAWYRFTAVSGHAGYYSIVVPKDCTGMKILRRGPSHNANSWEDAQKWNNTNDVAIPTDKDLVSITGWGGDDWAWSTYSK